MSPTRSEATSSKSSSPIAEIAQHDAFTLLVPDSTVSGAHWAPYPLSPSIIFTRVYTTNYNQLPEADPALEQAPAGAPTVALYGRLGVEVIDNYEASLSPQDEAEGGEDKGARKPLIVKIVDLSQKQPGYSREYYTRYLCSMAQVQENELAPLQGRSVPHFGGLFQHGSIYCLVFEDAGRKITYEEWLQKTVRDEILQAIKEINDAKVAPTLRQYRFFRRGGDGSVKIVFDEFGSRGWFEQVPPLVDRPDDKRTMDEKIADCCQHNLDEVMESFVEAYARRNANGIFTYNEQ